MNNELIERLDKIESHLAHLERLCDQLNQVVVDHGKQLGAITAKQHKISQTVESIELERIKAVNQKPPHYT